MKIRILFSLLLFTSHYCNATEFDVCKDVVIDQVTGYAFGQHGIYYSGEVTCYRDKEKAILKSQRFYENGKPLGRHICYNKEGLAEFSISYNHTSTIKHSFNYALRNSNKGIFGESVKCDESPDGACWNDSVCKENDKWCVFRYNCT